MEEKYVQMITEALQQAKSAHYRIDSLKDDIKEIKEDVKSTNKIAISVEKIAMETKAMREDMNNVDIRLKKIEDRPLKEYEDVKKAIRDKIVLFVLGIILTFIAFKLGLKNLI